MRGLWVRRCAGTGFAILSFSLGLACAKPKQSSLKDIVAQFDAESPAHIQTEPTPTPLPEGVARFEWRDSKVWASFSGADLDAVARLFLGEGRLHGQLPKVRLKGTVTMDFEGANPWEALQKILASQGYSSQYAAGRLLVSRPPSPEAGLCIEELLMSHVAAEEMEAFLAPAISGGVTLSRSPSSNGIFIAGPCGEVDRLVSLASAADRKAGTLSIETLIVKYVDSLGSNVGSVLQGQKGKFTGALGPGFIQLHYNVLDKLPSTFDASLSLLEREGKASIVSRPYIAVKSGREAKINLQQEEYFLATSSGYGSAVVSKLESVPAGVVLKIRPILMEEGKIDLKVEVEQSVFTAIPPGSYYMANSNVANVERSQAMTNVTVGDGQTLIIGGLVREVKSEDNQGLPGIRKVPLYNLLGGLDQKDRHREELVVYVTPRILHAP